MVLTPQQVLSVAAPFVSSGCDPAVALGLQREETPPGLGYSPTPATPALVVTNQGPVRPGTLVTFGGAGMDGKNISVSRLPGWGEMSVDRT